MPSNSPHRIGAGSFLWKQWPPDVAACWVLILVLWLVTRPYRGIVHDAQLYAVHALAALKPAAFAGDLYLRFGTQAPYTLFTPAYELAASLLGIAQAHLLLTVLGHLLWLAGLVFLVRSLIGDPKQAVLAVTLALALPAGYGGLNAVIYGEPYLTARLYGEALTMIGVGLAIRRQTVWAVLCLGATMTVHPIVALPGVAVAGAYAVQSDRRWAWLAAAVVVVGGALAFSGVQPFAQLLSSYDQEWLRIIWDRNMFGFVTRWTLTDKVQIVATVALAAVGLMLTDRGVRAFLAIALVVGVAGLLSAAIGGDGPHSKFFIFVQTWRSQWILVLAANIGAGAVLARLLATTPADLWPSRMVAVIGLAVLVATRVSQAFYYAAAPVLLLSLFMLGWETAFGRRMPRPAEALTVAVALLLAVGSTVFFLFFLLQSGDVWESLFEVLFVASTVVLVAAFLTGPSARSAVRPLHLLTIFLLVLSVILWDRRTEFQRFLESDEPVPPSLAALLPEGVSVYWEGGVALLWLKLQRASFFSCLQSANSGFFRDNAVAYGHRQNSLAPLHTVDYENLSPTSCPEKAEADAPPPTRETLAQACRREPELDYMVLMSPIDHAYFAEWRLPVSMPTSRVSDVRTRRYINQDVGEVYLYRCADLRGR